MHSDYKTIREDGTEVRKWDTITDFRGDDDEFDYISRIPELGKSGKIVTKTGRELYPQVFELRIVAR